MKSNAIIYVKDSQTVGIGAGQMSRVDSCKIAAEKARRMADMQGRKDVATLGSVVASDAFFPFADGLLEAIEAGASAVIHQVAQCVTQTLSKPLTRQASQWSSHRCATLITKHMTSSSVHSVL